MSDESAKLLAKRERINARLRQLKGREKRTSKKTEDRRKILAGAFLLEQAKRDPAIAQWMTRGLAAFLVRPEERELFDMKPHLVTDKADATSPQQPVELPVLMAQDATASDTARH
jgi:hypothetical protein